jgi:catechol 2,3-dioxygenase-like lactoylglutathione lyase family enzyme
MDGFKVQQIDHVEMFVPERYEAAGWFERVLGLQIMKDFEFWATEGGPLMISSDGGSTKIALFVGEPSGDHPDVGIRRIAFAVDGGGLLQFLQHIEEVPVYGRDGKRISSVDVVDHDQSWSIYFNDPYGNRFEVTTYDYDEVRDRLAAR